MRGVVRSSHRVRPLGLFSSGTGGRGMRRKKAQRHDPLDPEAGDQVAGEEAGGVHGQHVGRHDIGRVGLVEAAADHGQRRRGHHQVHQRVADHGADHGDGDARRGQKLPPGAALGAVFVRDRRPRDAQEEEQQRADQVHADHRQVGAHEGHDHGIGRELDQLRTDQGRGQPARHDVADRLGAERFGRGVGGGEAVEIVRAHVDPGEERAHQEHRERPEI